VPPPPAPSDEWSDDDFDVLAGGPGYSEETDPLVRIGPATEDDPYGLRPKKLT